MKKLYYLLLLIFAISHAQTAVSPDFTLLRETDFKISDGRMTVDGFPCQLTNSAATDRFLVSVCCKIQAFKEFGLQKINDMIVLANDKSRNTVSAKQGYKPDEIKMSYNPAAKSWSMTNLFSIEDEAGNIKKSLLTLDFDSSGKFVAMKRVF